MIIGWMLNKIRRILLAGNVVELANDVWTIDRDGAQLHVGGVDNISRTRRPVG